MAGPSTQSINARTRFCAVYGYPVKHSASPAMQNAAIAALGLDWRYLAFEVRPDELATAISGAKVMGFLGLNLTVPHKQLALEIVDVLDDEARAFGAVNTIRFEGKDERGGWRPLGEFAETPKEVRSHGFNTDANALVRALREELKLEIGGSKVLQLGAGGAGGTAALKLASEGVAELFLANRTAAKAEALARDIRQKCPAVRVSVGYPTANVDLVLNTTSLGLDQADPLPFDGNQFSLKRSGAVYDMIYRPAQTLLLETARTAGCQIANGLGMLLYQGAAAIELWTGRPAPVDVMRRALEADVYGEQQSLS